VMQIKNLGR